MQISSGLTKHYWRNGTQIKEGKLATNGLVGKALLALKEIKIDFEYEKAFNVFLYISFLI